MTSPWYARLAPIETQVPCAEGQHTIRWSNGELELTDHPDAEAEQVLAALGGDKPECVRLAESWGRQAADIDLLMVLPRSDDDQVQVAWDDVSVSRSPTRMGIASVARMVPHVRELQAVVHETRARQLDIVSVLAMGHSFQKLLVGTIAASAEHASPALVAALAGRVAPAIARWLDVNADDVTVAVHSGDGWGAMFAADDAVWVALPIDWLSRVWACGREIVDGRFVVGVTDTGLLAVGEPGGKPVEIRSETKA
jgi:hypothetical protein